MSGFFSSANSGNDQSLKRIDLIWIGTKMPDKYIDNLIELHKLIELGSETQGSEITINLWTDKSSRDATCRFGELIEGVKIQNTEDLLQVIIDKDSFLTKAVQLNLIKILMFEYAKPCNYAAIADFYRLLILINYGDNCLYLDTDIRINPNFSTRNLIASYEQNLKSCNTKNVLDSITSSTKTTKRLTEIIEKSSTTETELKALISTDNIPTQKMDLDKIVQLKAKKFYKELNAYFKNLGDVAASKFNNCIIFTRYKHNRLLINTLGYMIEHMTNRFDLNPRLKFATYEDFLVAKKNPHFYDYKEFGVKKEESKFDNSTDKKAMTLLQQLTLILGPVALWSTLDKLPTNVIIDESNPFFSIHNDKNWINNESLTTQQQEQKHQEITQLVKVLINKLFSIEDVEEMKMILANHKYNLVDSLETISFQENSISHSTQIKPR